MSNLDFRSDVSMQDVDVDNLVLFYLVHTTSTVAVLRPVQAPFLEQRLLGGSEGAAGSQVSRTAFKIKCRQDVCLDQPVQVLAIGSDPNQCDLVLDRRCAGPVHCQVWAQLNSGFDVWIIEDNSANGTLYRSRKDQKGCRSIDQAEEFETERFILKDRRAVQGLCYLKIGPYEFDCLPSEVNTEIAERERWFCRHEPLPVTSRMFLTQLAGRQPDTNEGKNIGKGGFGEVFKCMEMHTGLLVAVKKQKVGNDRGVESVAREVRSMRDLHHQNVVKILHSYETDPEVGLRVFHLTMPLYSCCLRDALPNMKHESKRKAMMQMVEGLKYIHSNDFLHRDIKPENIFISERTPTKVVLGDLGLLSPVGAIGQMAGTNIYRAPEVYFDLRQSSSIDIYALGITFLQMLDARATKGGWQGLKQWVEDLWDHPPQPFSYLIVQMTAPYPHTLRPCLDTIQRLLLQNKDLPESVDRPQLNLKEAMEMLKQNNASSAKLTPRMLTTVPTPRPAPPQPQDKPINSRLDPRLFDLRARYTLENSVTNRAGPLDLVHKARSLAPPGSPVPAIPQLELPDPERTQPGSILSPVQIRSNGNSATQGVDFTKPCAEVGNIFPRQKTDLLETRLKAERRMLEKRTMELDKMQRELAEAVRAHRRERGRRRKANGPCREPYPGEWPSRPMYSGAGSFSRPFQSTDGASLDSIFALTYSDLHLDEVSHRSRGHNSLRKGNTRSNRPARARIISHARNNNDRISKRANNIFPTTMLQGLTKALRNGAGEVGGRLGKSIRWMLGL